MTNPDRELLQTYATTRSQAAFAALVERYVDVVYAAARRQVAGDAHLAEDVTQATFIVLAEKVAGVPIDRPLSGWLLKTVAYCAANARRARHTREHYERRAAEMAPSPNTPDPAADARDEWAELAPLLDEGLNRLRTSDRDALLLRFFEQKTLGQVGDALGISEQAARKRVERAVDRLRDFFQRRGVAVSSGAVTLVLTTQAVEAAPVGLSGSIAASTATAAASGTSAASAAAVAKGAMITMATKKATAVAAAVLAALFATAAGSGLVYLNARSEAPPRTANTLSAVATSAAAPSSADVVTFTNGSTMQLLGIAEQPPDRAAGPDWLPGWFGGGAPPPPPTPLTWWSADGSPPRATPSLQAFAALSTGDDPDRRQVGFFFATRGPASTDSGFGIRIDGARGSANSQRRLSGELQTYFVASLPADLQRGRIHLGIASGPWREIFGEAVGTPASGPRPVFAVSEASGQTVVEFNQERLPSRIDGEQRLIAVLRSGREVNVRQWNGYLGGRVIVQFPCRSSDVGRLVWQGRPFEWRTLTNVALRPTTAPATRTSVASGK